MEKQSAINKFLQEIASEDFLEQSGEAKPVYAGPPHLATLRMKDIYNVNCPLTFINYKDGYVYTYWLKKGMRAIERHFLERQKENIKFIDNVENSWKKQVKKFRLSINKQQNTDLNKLNLKELAELFKEVSEQGHQQWKNVIFIDAFDLNGEKIVHEAIGKDMDVGIVTWPRKFSYSQRQELDLWKIAEYVLEKKQDKAFLDTKDYQGLPEDIKKLIKKHQQQFYWYQNNYSHILTLKEDHFFKQLKEILLSKSEKEIKSKIEKVENEFKIKNKERDKITKGLLPEARSIAYLFQKLTDLRDERKAEHCILVASMKEILKEIAKKSGVDLLLLENIYYHEIERLLLDRKGLIEELEERNKGMTIVVSEKQGLKFLTGDNYKKVKKLMEDKNKLDFKELTGQSVFKGVVKGQARVILKVSEFEEFKDGEILIAPMTRPEFLPLMKKAAAIVTDEGGLTCHAAIVSRELKKPCIVGTQMATRVLKTGDVVEVDADKGVVKIIERKER